MSVGVVIITKGHVPMLIDCIQSIIDKTTIDYNIYIGDTGSTSDELLTLKRYIKQAFPERNVMLHVFNRYNFAKCNNFIVREFVRDDYVLLCNNDIELIDNSIDIIHEKISNSDDVGTVGCRLLYEDGTVQHAGQFVNVVRNETTNRGFLNASHRGLRTHLKFKDWEPVVGNTGGFMMIKRELFLQAGGLNEQYVDCFEDVEFNLKLIHMGKTNMYTDTASCLHKESVTRGKGGLSISALRDHAMLLTPFFNSLDYTTKQKILNVSAQSLT